MAGKRTTQRGASIRCRLTPEVLARLRRLSDVLGMAPATIGSMAIGHYVANQERGLNMLDKIAEGVGANLNDLMQAAAGEQQKLFPPTTDTKKAKGAAHAKRKA